MGTNRHQGSWHANKSQENVFNTFYTSNGQKYLAFQMLLLKFLQDKLIWATLTTFILTKYFGSGFIFFKGIVLPTLNICWKMSHLQADPDVDEFASSSEQIWRNVAFHDLFSSGCSAVNAWVPSEWESKRHKISQAIYTTPVEQLMSCWRCWTLKCCFW